MLPTFTPRSTSFTCSNVLSTTTPWSIRLEPSSILPPTPPPATLPTPSLPEVTPERWAKLGLQGWTFDEFQALRAAVLTYGARYSVIADRVPCLSGRRPSDLEFAITAFLYVVVNDIRAQISNDSADTHSAKTTAFIPLSTLLHPSAVPSPRDSGAGAPPAAELPPEHTIAEFGVVDADYLTLVAQAADEQATLAPLVAASSMSDAIVRGWSRGGPTTVSVIKPVIISEKQNEAASIIARNKFQLPQLRTSGLPRPPPSAPIHNSYPPSAHPPFPRLCVSSMPAPAPLAPGVSMKFSGRVKLALPADPSSPPSGPGVPRAPQHPAVELAHLRLLAVRTPTAGWPLPEPVVSGMEPYLQRISETVNSTQLLTVVTPRLHFMYEWAQTLAAEIVQAREKA